MPLLNEMTPEQIESRINEDTSFGMPNDDIAVDIIARDSVSAQSFRRAYIKYLQDKKKFGPWMSPDPAPGE